MKEIHLTKKDFNIDWFSGTGAGGQHRNKHQNCCRITHIKTGLRSQGTEYRERISNQRAAFNRLAKLIIAHYSQDDIDQPERATDVIRNYHAVRNEVLDKSSGLRREYRQVVIGADLSEMIDARRKSMASN